MAKRPPNSGSPWTPTQVNKLEKLADGNTPTRLIAHKLGRSVAAIYTKASEKDISLNPHNVSPYGTGGKRRR